MYRASTDRELRPEIPRGRRAALYVALLLLCAFLPAQLGCAPGTTDSDASDGQRAATEQTERSAVDGTEDVPVLSTEQWKEAIAPETSLIQLIARPQDFHGRKVIVKGFLRLERENCAIYLSETDDEYLISANALWVSCDNNAMHASREELARQFSAKYVFLVGTFSASEHGQMNEFPGAFKDVTRIAVASSRSEYSARRKNLRNERKDTRGGGTTKSEQP